jgi:hypothetical protein
VAAILSELDVGPPRWRHLSIERQSTGRYTLTVEISQRPTRFVTTLPDWGATSEVGELLNTHSREAMARNGSELAKLRRAWQTKGGKELHIGVDITETDRLVTKVTTTRGKKKTVQVPLRVADKPPAKKAAKKAAKKKPVKKAATPVKRSTVAKKATSKRK